MSEPQQLNHRQDFMLPTDHLNFGLSIDCVIFGYVHGSLNVLLIQRNDEPFIGSWALPGYLVHPSKEIDHAAKDILQELTGLKDIYMEQFHTFGQLERHPDGRVVTVGYYSLVAVENYQPVASSWASAASWYDVNELPELAFDHAQIISRAFDVLQERVRNKPVGFELLPDKFTLHELQQLYEAALETTFDKPNFRKKILKMGILIPIDEYQVNVAHRPAKLFQFDEQKYHELRNKGFVFDI